jgi:hypothetical protein
MYIFLHKLCNVVRMKDFISLSHSILILKKKYIQQKWYCHVCCANRAHVAHTVRVLRQPSVCYANRACATQSGHELRKQGTCCANRVCAAQTERVLVPFVPFVQFRTARYRSVAKWFFSPEGLPNLIHGYMQPLNLSTAPSGRFTTHLAV